MKSKKECVNCKHYEHTAYIGLHPYVSCSYEPKETEKEKTGYTD